MPATQQEWVAFWMLIGYFVLAFVLVWLMSFGADEGGNIKLGTFKSKSTRIEVPPGTSPEEIRRRLDAAEEEWEQIFGSKFRD